GAHGEGAPDRDLRAPRRAQPHPGQRGAARTGTVRSRAPARRLMPRAAARGARGQFLANPIDSRAAQHAAAVIHILIRFPSTAAVEKPPRADAEPRKKGGEFIATPVDSLAAPRAPPVIHTVIRVPSTAVVDNRGGQPAPRITSWRRRSRSGTSRH